MDNLTEKQFVTSFKKSPQNLGKDTITDKTVISYTCHGKGMLKTNGFECELRRGSIVIIPPKQKFVFVSATSMTNYEIHIDNEKFDELLNNDNFPKTLKSIYNRPFTSLDGEEIRKTENIVCEIHREYEKSSDLSQYIIENFLRILLSYIVRYTEDKRLNKYIPMEIIDYIDSHLNSKLTLSELSAKCFYTPKYFSYIFKRCYNMTLKEYITSKRIQEGERLLRETQMSIGEISRYLGWQNTTIFYNNFKKVYGVTPLYYRKNHPK